MLPSSLINNLRSEWPENEFVIALAGSAALVHHFTLQVPVQAHFITTLQCYMAAVPCFLLLSYFVQGIQSPLALALVVSKIYSLYVPNLQFLLADHRV
jgi:hypothetical protein